MTKLEKIRKDAAVRVKRLNDRYRAQNMEHTAVSLGAGLTTAAAMGLAEGYGAPRYVAGIPYALPVGVLASVGAFMLPGAAGAAASGVAGAALSVWSKEATEQLVREQTEFV